MDNLFAEAVAAHIDVSTGTRLAHDALVSAMLVVLHDKVPGSIETITQHFEAMLPAKAQDLDPAPMAAFFRCADDIRQQLDFLRAMPRAG